MNEVFDKADAFLLGRFTYEATVGYWPNVTDPAIRVGVALNNLPKHVVTSTLTGLPWKNSVPLTGDIAKQVAELKQSPGNELQIHGIGALMRFLMGHGLIDAYRLITFPIVLDASRATCVIVNLPAIAAHSSSGSRGPIPECP
jgi:dihydrofolate reductase